MSVKDVMQLIKEIREESGRAEKMHLLGILASSELGEFVLKWTYDPLITFGIKPGRTEHQSPFNVTLRPTLVESLLERLSRRELTGHAAEAEVGKIMMELEPESGELLYMILNRDLRMGAGASSIQKVAPHLFKVMRVMRADSYAPKRVKSWPQAIEPKLDGHRSTFMVENGVGGFFTRTGHRVDSLEHLVEPIMDAVCDFATTIDDADLLALVGGRERKDFNFIIDGEAMVAEAEGSFNKASGALRRSSEDAPAQLHVYDLLSRAEFEHEDAVPRTYTDRRRLTEKFVKGLASEVVLLTPRYLVRNEEELNQYYADFLDAGYEGAMVKNPQGFYAKRKSVDWLKMKPEDTEDLPIIGFFNGDRDGKWEKGTGGIIVDRAGVEVRISGMKDEMRAEIHELWLHDATELHLPLEPGFKGQTVTLDQQAEMPNAELKLLGRLVEVKYNEVTEDGSLRHPRFIKFRDDKNDVSILEAAE